MTRNSACQGFFALGPILVLAALLALIGGASGKAASPAPTGLVAAYSFDGGTGTTLADLSGNSNGGTISGAAWTTGHAGGALSFDGVNDVVNVPDSNSLDVAQVTVEAWVRPTSLGGQWRTVALKEKTGQMAYALYAGTNAGGASGHVNVKGTTDVFVQNPSILPVNAWTHLASTYDGTRIRLYANGVQVASKAVTGRVVVSGKPLKIGGNTVWDEWFAGKIDDLRIYNRALTPAEINGDMATPVAGGGTPADTQAPTAPGTPSVTSTSGTSISIGWAASSDNVAVTGYAAYRNGVNAGSPAGTTYTYSALACGTSYTLAVDAFDAAGNRSAKSTITGATAACTPPPPDTTAPTSPPNFTVVGTTGTSISVAWSSSLDNVAVTGYGLYKNSVSTGSTAGLSSTFAGLTCGTSYTLAVDAFDAAGNRSAKSTATASTGSCADTTAPTVPGNFAMSSRTTTSISGSWTASTDATGVTGYDNYRDGTMVGSQAGNSRMYSGLACGTSYVLDVDAFDAAGNRSAKSTATASTMSCPPAADTTAPTVPGSFTVTTTTANSLSVGWTASTDNTAVTGYSVYRGGASFSSQTGTTYTYTGLACNTSYSLAVEAFDAAGNRSGQATTSGLTAACSAPGPGNGNLWVDTNGGSCTRQATAGSYVDAQACGSFNAAYAIASPGDTIYIKGGTYTAFQDIAFRSIAATPVRLQAAPNENVILDNGMTIRTHDLIFEGGGTVGINEPDRISVYGENGSESAIDFGRGNNSPSVKGNVIEDVHTRNVYFDDDSTNDTVRYSEVGPSDFGGNGNLCADLIVTGHTFNPVIEYNQIHDNKNDGCNGAHIDALDLNVVNGVIRGNRIWWCGTQCIFAGDPVSMLIENNMIEETNACGSGCDGPQELAVMGDVTVRYNTIEGDDGYGRDPDRPGNADVYGNIFLSNHGGGCGGSGTVKTNFHDNVFAPGSGACGTNAKFCTPRLASNGQLWTNVDQNADYHLGASDTCALGAGASANVAPRDIDEQARPQGGVVDAGADER